MSTIEKTIEKMQQDFHDHQREDDKHFSNIEASLTEMKEMLEEITRMSAPVNEWFTNIKWGKKVLMGILTVFGTVVGIIWGLKNIFTK